MRSPRARSEFSREVFTFIDGLERLSTLDCVSMALEEALAPFGIESFIVTGLPTKDRPFDDLVIASRWPPEFFMLYVENDYARFDPLTQQSIQAHMPFEWSAESYRSSADSRVAEVMARSADFGLRHGYLVPIHGPSGYEGCVSMAGAELTLSGSAKAAIHLMALYAFDRMRRLRGQRSDRKSPLTAREREVLTWAAKGKSASQISQTLKISKRTVDEHTQTAARKLGAANRTQAVAIALRDRIIEA
jgi:LuxR family transcriptional regulator, quorum-sensing system regulator BjaR1